MNRRDLLRGLGGVAALAAVIPSLARAASAAHPPRSVLEPGAPEDAGMSAARLEDVFARVARRVGDGLFPGATALVARRGVIVGERAFGSMVRGADEPVTLDTMFDVQSMTKVLATAISALVLVDQGHLHLDDPVAAYLPAFAANGKSGVTVRDMLRYSSGLPIDNHLLDIEDPEEVFQQMAETPLEYPTGSMVLYSDLTYRLLGRVIEAAAGTDLDTFARTHVWGPLGMTSTMYNPPASLRPRIAATGYSERRGYLVRGEVQDEQDFALGGVAGCDGVFTTARDAAVFCQAILNGGVYGGARVLRAQSTREMVSNQTPQVSEAETDLSPITNLLLTPKGYGWELATHRFSNGGMRLKSNAYGKAGGAGTFMWVDPARQIIGVLLTNHGLPVPFDEIGWNRLLDSVGCAEFFDGVINAVSDD